MSKISYRAIPISLEEDAIWLKLSLKRRALFIFIMCNAVDQESYFYKGKILTYGQYVWSFRKLAKRFNETVCPDDQFSNSGCQKAIEYFIEKGFIKTEKWGGGVQLETLITITQSDVYELIKTKRCTPNREQSTPSVHPESFDGVHLENILNQPLDSSTEGISETENEASVHIENIVNMGAVYTQQETTDSTTKILLEDNVRTLPFSSSKRDDADVVKKFKVQDEQVDAFNWLNSEKIDSPVTTLCYWAKTYSMKRLKEVHKVAVQAKPTHKGRPKSIGAIMNHLLKNNIPVETDSHDTNAEFMHGFVDREHAMNWKVEKKYVTCEIKGIRKEVFLDLHPDAFVNQLIMLENQFKESRT